MMYDIEAMFQRKRTYLDWAAAASVSRKARAAFLRSFGVYGNPSAAHAEGRAAKALLEKARSVIAGMAGAKPDAVIFTSGATEANAIAFRGRVKAFLAEGERASDMHVLYQAGAHASIAETAAALVSEGIRADVIPLKDGDIDLKALKGLIRPETAFVSMEAVSAETGARFDTRGVRRVLDEARREGGPRIILHVDAAQLPLTESFERTRLAADLISLDAQKVGGVRGIGCLIRAPGVALVPVTEGGGQERGLRPGTEPVAAASAFACALGECAARRDAFAKRAFAARERLAASIMAAVPDALVNEGKENVPRILNMSFPGRDTDYLAALLDEKGFAVSTKSACETDSTQGSRAVLAQTGDAARAASTLRISWGPQTAGRDLERFAKALAESVRFLDRNTL